MSHSVDFEDSSFCPNIFDVREKERVCVRETERESERDCSSRANFDTVLLDITSLTRCLVAAAIHLGSSSRVQAGLGSSNQAKVRAMLQTTLSRA
jgi:hypothetical protein